MRTRATDHDWGSRTDRGRFVTTTITQKRTWKAVVTLLVVSLMAGTACRKVLERKVCNEEASRMLAVTYGLSVPVLPTDQGLLINTGGPLATFVASNPAAFEESGLVVLCARLVGERIQREGVRMYDASAYDRVIDDAPAEIAHLAPSVADRINEPATGLMTLGTELIWLSNVLPSVARGDLSEFQNTGAPWRINARIAAQLANAIWPVIQGMCRGDVLMQWGCDMVNQQMRGVGRLSDLVAVGMVYYLARVVGS